MDPSFERERRGGNKGPDGTPGPGSRSSDLLLGCVAVVRRCGEGVDATRTSEKRR